MEVKTRALVDSEHALRKARNDIRRICDDINLVACVIASMKSLDVPKHRLNLITEDLENLTISVSQMACFLEMANETYIRTEKRITDLHSENIFNKFSVHWVINNPKIIEFQKISAMGSDWDLKQIFKSIESD